MCLRGRDDGCTHVKAMERIPPPAPDNACAILSLCWAAAEAAAAFFCCSSVDWDMGEIDIYRYGSAAEVKVVSQTQLQIFLIKRVSRGDGKGRK